MKSYKKSQSFSLFSFTLWLAKIILWTALLSLVAKTLLTLAKPNNTSPVPPSVKPSNTANPVNTANASPSGNVLELPLKKNLVSLQDQIVSLAKKQPKLKPYALFVDLDNGNYVAIDSTQKVSAASTIKAFILYAFFQDVDAGKIHLEQKLTMTKDDIAGGSGDMQYQKPNSQFTALETAKKMIEISDNTATNMLIRLLGGKEIVNKRIVSWGMNSTYLKSPLPDLKGTNQTTTQDLALVFFKINRGELLTPTSRAQMLKILEQTTTKTLLPAGLEAKTTIAHKTGDIGIILGDAGLITTPNGQHYIGVVFVERPYNDIAGRILIQKISKITNQGFKNFSLVASKKI